jgi:hypothetical protein
MARTWLRIRVDLLGGGGIDCDPSPGRIFLVGPSHTFEQFAEAIDAAFARWDLSHLHNFELKDGRLIGYPDDSFAPELVWLDHATRAQGGPRQLRSPPVIGRLGHFQRLADLGRLRALGQHPVGLPELPDDLLRRVSSALHVIGPPLAHLARAEGLSHETDRI